MPIEHLGRNNRKFLRHRILNDSQALHRRTISHKPSVDDYLRRPRSHRLRGHHTVRRSKHAAERFMSAFKCCRGIPLTILLGLPGDRASRGGRSPPHTSANTATPGPPPCHGCMRCECSSGHRGGAVQPPSVALDSRGVRASRTNQAIPIGRPYEWTDSAAILMPLRSHSRLMEADERTIPTQPSDYRVEQG